MNKQQQKQFVAELGQNILDEVYDLIDTDKIPAEWDGHELRKYLADRFERAVYTLTPQRKRAYRNAVLVNDL